jgi:amino acid adenylation domain-containing protein
MSSLPASDPAATVADPPCAEERAVDGARSLACRGCEPELLPDLVARWAAERPGAAAVTGLGKTITYTELEARANRLARALVARGVTRDGVVATCLERSVDWVVALLAAMRAGAAHMPLGPDDPPSRQADMLRRGGALAVVSTSGLLPDHAGLPRLDLDRLEGELARLEPSRPPVAIPRRGLAYVLFTSGSTAQPKAVGLEHASLASYVVAAQRAYGLRAGDRVLHFSALTHDGSLEEVGLTLACGGTVVLRSEAMLGSAADFLGECAGLGVSVLSLPTAFWHELTDYRDLELWPELRLVILGGESASAERLARWCERARGAVPVINTYGPAETTVMVTAIRLDRPGGADTGPWLPIGWPIDGAELLVLDDSLQPVPPGVVGELSIGGPGLARGYLTDAGRTAAAFLPHPYSRTPGARMYRTGDLVRPRADGHTVFVGRRDHQVKVRGYRVDPEEVVAALARHPAVGRSAVIARRKADGTNALAAVAEPRPGLAVKAGELRAHLRGLVPGYMVPARFAVVPRLPTLSTGKVDRARLGELVDEAASDEEPAAAAADGLVEVATGIIAEVLETPVGPDHSFFEAGGDSLMAVRVLSRLHTASGVRVPIVDFFDTPTGAGLAATVERIRANDGGV